MNKTVRFAGATLAVLMLLIISALSFMGGNSDTHKSGVEGFFRQITGYDAQIAELRRFTFFPAIGTEFTGLTLTDPASQALRGGADGFAIATPTWRIFTAQNTTLQTLIVRNFFYTGADGRTLRIAAADLHPTVVDDKAGLLATGSYADKPFTLSLELKHWRGMLGHPLYALAKSGGFGITLGDLILSGLYRQNKDGLHLDDLVIQRGETLIAAGSMVLSGRDEPLALTLKGDLHVAALSMHYDLARNAETRAWGGTIDFPHWDESLYLSNRDAVTALRDTVALFMAPQPGTAETAVTLTMPQYQKDEEPALTDIRVLFTRSGQDGTATLSSGTTCHWTEPQLSAPATFDTLIARLQTLAAAQTCP